MLACLLDFRETKARRIAVCSFVYWILHRARDESEVVIYNKLPVPYCHCHMLCDSRHRNRMVNDVARLTDSWKWKSLKVLFMKYQCRNGKTLLNRLVKKVYVFAKFAIQFQHKTAEFCELKLNDIW